jgi:hypothetical protein
MARSSMRSSDDVFAPEPTGSGTELHEGRVARCVSRLSPLQPRLQTCERGGLTTSATRPGAPHLSCPCAQAQIGSRQFRRDSLGLALQGSFSPPRADSRATGRGPCTFFAMTSFCALPQAWGRRWLPLSGRGRSGLPLLAALGHDAIDCGAHVGPPTAILQRSSIRCARAGHGRLAVAK